MSTGTRIIRRIFFYLLILLFLLPACGGTKSIYEQKRSLMILDVTEQPRNKKALAGSKKRAKRNKKKVNKRSQRTKSHRRR
jgi:hypothetical protein